MTDQPQRQQQLATPDAAAGNLAESGSTQPVSPSLQPMTRDDAQRLSSISKQLQMVGLYVGIFFAVLLLVLIGMGVYSIFNPGFREGWRDISIAVGSVFLMVVSSLGVVLLITILFIIKQISDQLQLKVIPRVEQVSGRLDGISGRVEEIVGTTQGVIGNVRESSDALTSTTNFAAEKVVTPIIRVGGLMAGVQAFARTLAQRDTPPPSAGSAGGTPVAPHEPPSA